MVENPQIENSRKIIVEKRFPQRTNGAMHQYHIDCIKNMKSRLQKKRPKTLQNDLTTFL